MTDDADQLRLLSIFHYVVGGLSAICACFPFIHLAVGIALVSGAIGAQNGGPTPPPLFGWFFIVIASVFIIVGWTYAIGTVVAGRMLQRRQSYKYCMVMACLHCPNMPFGTCLGIFSIIVLQRPSVKLLFEKAKMAGSRSELDLA